jgi:hypothetical protein
MWGKFMDNQENNNELNELEKQVQEINEWQKNANNPSYYVCSGKTRIPLKNLLKSPIVMLIVGILFLLPTIFNIVTNLSIYTITADLMPLIIGIVLFNWWDY